MYKVFLGSDMRSTKSYKLQVPLTNRQRKALEEVARLCNLPTATWARMILLNEGVREKQRKNRAKNPYKTLEEKQQEQEE